MKKLLVLLLFLGGVAAPAQNFYSLQHPEWPPMPGPFTNNLRCFHAEGDNWVVDDRGFQYPPAETNRLAALMLKRQKQEEASAAQERKLDAECMRFPELLKLRVGALLAETNSVRRAENETKINALVAMSRTNPPAHFSLAERQNLEMFRFLGEVIKTNREAIQKTGVYYTLPDGRGGGWYRGSLKRVERLAPLAAQALASTNRADVEAFLQEKNTKVTR